MFNCQRAIFAVWQARLQRAFLLVSATLVHQSPLVASTPHSISHSVPHVKGVSQKIWDDLFSCSSHLPRSFEGYSLYLLPFTLGRWSDPHSDDFSFVQLRFVLPQYWSRMLATGNTPLAIWDVNLRLLWLTAPNCCLSNFIIFCYLPNLLWVQVLFTQNFCETTINYTTFA